MLSEQEIQRLATLAKTGRTPDVTESLRALARTERVGDMVEAISVVVRNCEIMGEYNDSPALPDFLNADDVLRVTS